MKYESIRMFLGLLTAIFLQVPAYGGQYRTENQDIPVIVKWREGHGFGKDGRMLEGGWAFDPENGSYVRFEEGSVMVKADHILETDDYEAYFTDTEAAAGTLAVRGEVIRHFSGSIRVVVENVETHLEKTCFLTYENEYRYNLPVPEGRYQVKEAEAVWNKKYYTVSTGGDVLEVKDNHTCLMEIQVLPEGDGADQREAWEQVNESGAEVEKAEQFSRVISESSNDKQSEITSMHWPEIYLMVVIFIAGYGLCRYWTKRR